MHLEIVQPKDYADEERQQMVANWQPNWYAALGMILCLLSGAGIIALAVWIAG